jgi:hypothetical protein
VSHARGPLSRRGPARAGFIPSCIHTFMHTCGAGGPRGLCWSHPLQSPAPPSPPPPARGGLGGVNSQPPPHAAFPPPLKRGGLGGVISPHTPSPARGCAGFLTQRKQRTQRARRGLFGGPARTPPSPPTRGPLAFPPLEKGGVRGGFLGFCDNHRGHRGHRGSTKNPFVRFVSSRF